MIELSIPGRGGYSLAHLALDLNGTLAFDGELIDGVPKRLRALRPHLALHLLTADTFGLVPEIEAELKLSAVRVRSSDDKLAFVERMGPEAVVAIGNGANDAGMLAAAALGIAVLGPEGLACQTLQAADLVAPDVLAALDLLLYPKRLIASLRR